MRAGAAAFERRAGRSRNVAGLGYHLQLRYERCAARLNSGRRRLILLLALCVGVFAAIAAPAARAASGVTLWSTATVDQQPPYAVGEPLVAVSCASTSLCVAVAGDDLIVSSAPAGGSSA